MLRGFKVNVENMSFSLCGKQSKWPQKYNGTTLPRFGSKGTGYLTIPKD